MYTQTTDFPFAAGAARVLAQLREGRTLEVPLVILAELFGPFCSDSMLCEDGRTYLLLTSDACDHVFLTHGGDVLVVSGGGPTGSRRVRLFTGPAADMWDDIGRCDPPLVPGRGALPRYWLLREPTTPFTSLYCVYDLAACEVRVRMGGQAEAIALVHRWNGTGAGRGL